MEKTLLDLNAPPQDTDDVPLPLPSSFEQKYEDLGPSTVGNNHFTKLGFVDGCDTLRFIRDKRVKFPGKLYDLVRSLFNRDFTEKDKFPEPLGNWNDEDTNRIGAAEVIEGWLILKKAKAQVSAQKKRGRKKGKKKVRSTRGPRTVEKRKA